MILIEAALFVKKNLDWYILNRTISIEAALCLADQINQKIKNIAEHSLDICEAFNIPKHVIYAPIYTGYKDYYNVNKTDGEHYYLKAKF